MCDGSSRRETQHTRLLTPDRDVTRTIQVVLVNPKFYRSMRGYRNDSKTFITKAFPNMNGQLTKARNLKPCIAYRKFKGLDSVPFQVSLV